MTRTEDAVEWLQKTETELREVLARRFEKCPELLSWADRNGAWGMIDDLVADLYSVIRDAEDADSHSQYEARYA